MTLAPYSPMIAPPAVEVEAFPEGIHPMQRMGMEASDGLLHGLSGFDRFGGQDEVKPIDWANLLFKRPTLLSRIRWWLYSSWEFIPKRHDDDD